MRYSTMVFTAFLLVVGGCLAEKNAQSVLTAEMVTNLVVQGDRLSVEGNVDAMSELLSKDVTITCHLTNGHDEVCLTQNRAEYLEDIRDVLTGYRYETCTSRIEKIVIAPAGDQAEVDTIVVNECVPRSGYSPLHTPKWTMSNKATVRLQGGRPKYTKIVVRYVTPDFNNDLHAISKGRGLLKRMRSTFAPQNRDMRAPQ